MTFESWLSLIIGAVGSIATVLSCFYAHKANKRSKRLEEKIKESEWSLTRRDADEWLLERKGSGKVKVYGYSLDKFDEYDYDSLPRKFNTPMTFVEGSKLPIQEQLERGSWDLTLYFNDFNYSDKTNTDTELSRQDSEIWTQPMGEG